MQLIGLSSETIEQLCEGWVKLSSKLSQDEVIRDIGLDNMFGFLITRMSYLLKKHLVAELNDQSFTELARGEELVVLARIFERPGLSQSEISDLTIKNKSTVTRLINSLEKKGFVKRLTDHEDKRSHKIYMTDTGSKILKKFVTLVLETVGRISEDIDEQDMKTTFKTLKILYENILALHRE